MATDKIQLYSLATPNGQKASVALEMMGLDYDAHKIDIMKGDQFTDEFVKMNPNSKIPAIVDPNGPSGSSHTVFESGAILVYLAEKTGKFLPTDPVKKSETLQWLFFQMASVGPMFGQFGHFYKYAGDKCDHPYPKERYTNEVKRLLQVLETRLSKSQFLASDDFSIADIATFPWVMCLDVFYKGSEVLELPKHKYVNAWVETCLGLPGVEKGLTVCSFD